MCDYVVRCIYLKICRDRRFGAGQEKLLEITESGMTVQFAKTIKHVNFDRKINSGDCKYITVTWSSQTGELNLYNTAIRTKSSLIKYGSGTELPHLWVNFQCNENKINMSRTWTMPHYKICISPIACTCIHRRSYNSKRLPGLNEG